MTDTDQPTGADSPALDEIARAIRDVARIQGTFTLRSGAVSDTYFNKYRFEADPALLKRIGETLLPLIPQEVTVLAPAARGWYRTHRRPLRDRSGNRRCGEPGQRRVRPEGAPDHEQDRGSLKPSLRPTYS